MGIVDELSPSYLGEDRIALQLSADTPVARAFNVCLVDVSYLACEPEGVVLPLEFSVVGPSGGVTHQRRLYSRFAPSQLAFTPREGGEHMVRLGEANHNRWFGALVIPVAGDRLLA